MNIEKATLKRMELAMAFTRQGYIQTMRDDYLKGAFGEFMCRQIALSVGEKDNWSNKVERLLSHPVKMIDPKTKIKGFKDRDSANREAVYDMKILLQAKVTFAKGKVAGYYPKKMPKIQKLQFDNEAQFKLMLEEFLPSFLKYLS